MSRSDRITLAAVGSALVLAVAAVWLVFAPVADDAPELATALTAATPAGSVPASAQAERAGIVVDVQGAVLEPGVRELPADSRIADAIAAAGGYASDVDLDATAAAINLAKTLADGEQIHVPRLGDSVSVVDDPAAASDGASSGGGMVDLNTATPEELEALPGIGPVTVQKIVAARQEQPFASLEDAVERGVINRGQLEDIQGVATAG